jgi:hypothetical protein
MLDTTRQCKGGIGAIGVVVAVLLSGCAQTTDWLQGRNGPHGKDSVILGAPEAEVYLDELNDLISGDPARQAEIIADANSAATLTPGPSSRLRLGLLLATPGHAAADAEAAQRLLRDVLSQKLLLTPAEVALATIHLNSAEQQIVANAEARQLRSTSSRAARSEEKAINQRLATVETENRRLRRELEAAEKKLEAITSIEQSIREHE